MMFHKLRSYPVVQLVVRLLFILLVIVTVPPTAAFAQGNRKTVRVGCHEEPYFITDQNGRRSGYSYEYLWKISAFTGWDYEYVTGSWSELLQMLKKGEIDLMSNVSYMEERTNSMLYSSLPMGMESYYIFTAPDNTQISAEDYSTLEGKRVGVTKDSYQEDLFKKWAKMHGIAVELVELSDSDEESRKRLGKDLDAFVTIDVYADPDAVVPVCKIGSSDFYFAVSKKRADLLPELDNAMSRIQDEDKYFNQQLHTKYLTSVDAERYLDSTEKQWLSEHGSIRVGYQDNYLAFCAADPLTGDLTGALKDYLEYASDALDNGHLNFEPVSFATVSEAIEALKKGEVDCVFPANMTDYDCEELDIVMTSSLMRTEMDAVVRASEKKAFLKKQAVTVAVNKGNTNYDVWLSENFPDWTRAYYEDTQAGLEAVAAGEADCLIISNYRYSNISRQCEKLRLATVYSVVDMDYCFALNKGDTVLYTILAKANNAVPEVVIHTALTYYSTEDVRTSFSDVIKDNLFSVLAMIAGTLSLILLLLLRNIQSEKKIIEEKRLVNTLNKRVYVDALTSVRNKGAFSDYKEALRERLDRQAPFEFAIGVFDCNNLKRINDHYGHDKGDIYLKAASCLICRVFKNSPVFRIGGDEFAVVLEGEDFQNRNRLLEVFEEGQKEACARASAPWEEVSVAGGIAVYDHSHDQSVNDTVRRADKLMYANKAMRRG